MLKTFHLLFVMFVALSCFFGALPARASGVLDFFTQELDASEAGQSSNSPPSSQQGGGAPPSGPASSSKGSINDLFGAVPGVAESGGLGLSPGASLGGSAGGEAALSSENAQERIRDEAFEKALKGMLPLEPKYIRRLLEEFDRTQESYELPVYPLPKPEMTVQTLSLDPGAKPLTIRVAQGHVTTLNMLDVTGAPWPIEDITWAGNFHIIQSGDTENGVHFVRITPQSEFAYGNMSIKMLGLKTPLVMTIETSRDLVHYRFDAIIPDYGPMAEAPLIEGGVSMVAGNPTMSSVLQGVIPTGAKRLTVNGVDARTTAYRYGGQMYVRTPLTLLSPSWSSSVSSADGMRVYTIKQAPVLLLSDKGQMMRANVSLDEGS